MTALGRLAIVGAALAGLAMVVVFAPGYLVEQGYPLDDAWTHAVYGRELARSFALAYNPGVPATGSTSPLWSALVAVPHAAFAGVADVVVATKLLGFALHALGALLLAAALGARPGPAIAGGMIVALHPHLVAAAVSGMEVPLAALAAGGLLYATARGRLLALALASAVAALARPELAVLSIALPILFHWRRPRELVRLLGAAAAGDALVFGAFALRNLSVSGMPLPATFYGKVDTTAAPALSAIWNGLDAILAPTMGAGSAAPIALGILSIALIATARRDRQEPAAVAFAAGILFCAVSFALIPPIDPRAFYHQRYILPAVPLALGAIPSLVDAMLRGNVGQRVRVPLWGAASLLLVAGALADAPSRYGRLASDAGNIDDVQVRVGRALGTARPSEVVWAVDAGAVRYFGNAFVVDLMGLNTPEILGPRAQEFLDRHGPSYLEVVPEWSSIDGASSRRLRARKFTPEGPYTVTSYPAMRTHFLVDCGADLGSGVLRARARTFRFACAAADSAVAQSG